MNATRGDLRVLGYQPMVRCLAKQLKRRLPPSIELDDCIQAGMLAVCTAGEGMPRAWMRQRIWWAMIDSVKGKEYREATRPSLTLVEDGRPKPNHREPVDRRPNVEQIMVARDAALGRALEAKAQSDRVQSAIADSDPLNQPLTRREKRVLGLRYSNRGATQMLTARQMHISQTRVSQLQAKAIGRLQSKLQSKLAA